MSKFLVAGGAGFIGSHIVDKLLSDGHTVRVLDNFSSGNRKNLSLAEKISQGRLEIITGDIQDKDICAQSCEGMDYVILLAALRSVPKSMKDPEAYNNVNINGTLFMLQAAARHNIKRFVFSSSSSVYGDADVFPETEDLLPKLISPYALSKLAGEYYCKIFAEFFNVPTVCLRYFNVFGPRQALDDEYAVVIPKFIHCLLHDQPPPIFGNGKQSRDFTYIDNVVSANILAATTPDIKHAVLNVAPGESHSVLDLVATLNRIIGKNIAPKFLPIRVGDIFRTEASIAKIQKTLNYQPLVNFEEGLRRTVDYFKSQASR
jgi:nucleoside-diphosphate-sugar epimerase